MDMNDDLQERLWNAARQLETMASDVGDDAIPEFYRLAGKAQGVWLALSYLREGYTVVTLPKSDRGWGAWDGFTADESYVVGAGEDAVFLEDDDSVTRLSIDSARKLAGALLAAVAKTEK